MSAVPKKKLCWNCEGNVSRQTDNCPYCGVYLHGAEEEAEDSWNPTYRLTPLPKEEDDALPPVKEKTSKTRSEDASEDNVDQISFQDVSLILDHLKKDVLPIFLLLFGSSFFIFGTILFLFSHEGTLTLQWKGENWIYFLFLGIPALYFGWYFLQETETNPKP